PFYVDRIEARIGDDRRGSHPIQALRLLAPEAVRILQGPGVKPLIFLSRAVAILRRSRGWRDAFGHGSSLIVSTVSSLNEPASPLPDDPSSVHRPRMRSS